MRALRDVAHENRALLAFVEVQTGMGITGRMWAHQHDDVRPDLLAFGKKAQVCGMMAGPMLDEEPENVFHVSSRINSTWGGNLVDMVRCRRYLEIIEEERLVENAGGRYPVSAGLFQLGPVDLMAQVRGHDRLALDCYDCPEQVEEHLRIAHTLIEACSGRISNQEQHSRRGDRDETPVIGNGGTDAVIHGQASFCGTTILWRRLRTCSE